MTNFFSHFILIPSLFVFSIYLFVLQITFITGQFNCTDTDFVWFLDSISCILYLLFLITGLLKRNHVKLGENYEHFKNVNQKL